jgi:uncharacterized tellurite resistance protein B-like protein
VNCNPNVPHASDFQSVLNYLINLAQPEIRRVDKKIVAVEMDLKPDTVQRHANGTIPTNADFARDIIRAVAKTHEDIALELISFFVPAGFRVVRESNVKTAVAADIRDQQLDLSRHVGRIQELVKEALADGRLDRAEHRTISRKVASLKTIATELDERLKGEVL